MDTYCQTSKKWKQQEQDDLLSPLFSEYQLSHSIKPHFHKVSDTLLLLQKHLIPHLSKGPHVPFEKIDKLIIKYLLESTTKYPEISQIELAFYVGKQLEKLSNLFDTYTHSQIKKMLVALLAEQKYSTSHKMEKILEEIPYSVAEFLKNELAILAFDTPWLMGERLIEETAIYFQKAEGLLTWIKEGELERKIQFWSLQEEMLLRWYRLPSHSALYQEVLNGWNRRNGAQLPLFVKEVSRNYLHRYPHLSTYVTPLEVQIWIHLKSIWYTDHFGEEIPTYNRFLLWHLHRIEGENLDPDESIERLEELSRKKLPLIPFRFSPQVHSKSY